jgi:hypothetical protein
VSPAYPGFLTVEGLTAVQLRALLAEVRELRLYRLRVLPVMQCTSQEAEEDSRHDTVAAPKDDLGGPSPWRFVQVDDMVEAASVSSELTL